MVGGSSAMRSAASSVAISLMICDERDKPMESIHPA